MSKATPWQIATQTTSTGGSGSDANLYFAQRINTDVSTNLNNLAQTIVPIDGAITTAGSGWAINGSGIELLGASTNVRCSFSVHVAATFNRGNMRVQLALDGVPFGPIAAHGYIRNGNGHQESSYTCGPVWVSMNTNQVITIVSLREAAAGTISLAQAGTSQLLLERLVNV